MELLKNELKIEDGASFVTLNRLLNELIERELIVELDGVYHLISDFKRGYVLLRRGSAFIKEGIYELEIDNWKNLGLLKNDEVLYEPLKGKAHVLSVLKRNTVYVVGVITIRKRKKAFMADDPAYKGFRVVNLESFKGLDHLMKVRCYIADYRKRLLKIDELIGYSYESGVQERSILASYNVKTAFSKEAEKEALAVEPEEEERKDLRKEMMITIDGDDSKDFDDSIGVVLNDEGYVLYVNIADVTAFVKENSILDKEARDRGTSIYYPGHVVPMLPFVLSDDKCSLLPHKERATITCEMHFDFNGELLDHSIYPSLICSAYRMTYKKVNGIYDNDAALKEEYGDLLEMLYNARILSSLIEKKRKRRGGIDFALDECVIKEENGQVVDIVLRESGVAEKMIENFMIAANVTVAEHLYYLDLPAVYRNHDYPKSESLASFIDTVEALGYVFKGNRLAPESKQLANSLAFFEGKEEYSVISEMLLRCMVKARYENVSIGHYGLGLEHYCHFTSPIRRYPDLMVHRMLRKYVFKGDLRDLKEDVVRNGVTASNCNEREKRAISIERDIVDLKKCEYMKQHLYETFEGVISGVTSFGFYVKLPNTVEGLVHVSTLDGFYELDDKGALTNGSKAYRLGDRVRIVNDFVDVYRGTIDFVLKV